MMPRYTTFTPEGDFICQTDTAQAAGERAIAWLEHNPSAPFCYSVDHDESRPFQFTRHGRMEWPGSGWPATLHASLESCLKG